MSRLTIIPGDDDEQSLIDRHGERGAAIVKDFREVMRKHGATNYVFGCTYPTDAEGRQSIGESVGDPALLVMMTGRTTLELAKRIPREPKS